MTNGLHEILMITCNRPTYTRLALTALLATCNERMRVWVWQNGDHSETIDVVESLSSHPCFNRLHISKENKMLKEPTNWFWRKSTGDYLSKVDDDCLVTKGWAETLTRAHQDVPELGVIGCWRFYNEDFIPTLAFKKIQTFGGKHQVMRNCWVQGSGYIVKRACLDECGPLRPKEGFFSFCLRLAREGWTNGWYFPFIREEHMDDPRSDHNRFQTDEDFRANPPLGAIEDDIQTLEQWSKRIRYIAHNCQSASPDPHHYFGWRSILFRLKRRAIRFVHRPF